MKNILAEIDNCKRNQQTPAHKQTVLKQIKEYYKVGSHIPNAIEILYRERNQ